MIITTAFTNDWITQSAKMLYRGAGSPSTSKFYLGLANSAVLTRASSITDFISAELLPVNGYSRANVTFSADGSYNATSNRHEMPTLTAVFTASGASLQWQTAFLMANAQAIASQSFTNSNVNPTTDRITITNHGYINGDKICFTVDATGILPSGISTGVIYTVASVTTNDFQIQLNGSTVDITNTGSGTFRAREANCSIIILAVESSPVTLANGQSYTYQVPIILANTGYVNGV